MRATFRLAVLEWISEAGGDISDAFVAFTKAGNNLSVSRFEYLVGQARNKRLNLHASDQREKFFQRRYNDMLYHLQKDGLIEVKNEKNGIFILTKRGLLRLKTLREEKKKSLPIKKYVAQPSSKPLIVTFDIPEKDRRKRAWLRSVLKNLGLRMVQQSVWIGKRNLPKEFLRDLKQFELIECVEIFQVSASGSLRHII